MEGAGGVYSPLSWPGRGRALGGGGGESAIRNLGNIK